MWKVTLALFAVILILMGVARWLEDTEEERAEKRELNRKARAGHRDAMSYANGFKTVQRSRRYGGAMMYGKGIRK